MSKPNRATAAKTAEAPAKAPEEAKTAEVVTVENSDVGNAQSVLAAEAPATETVEVKAPIHGKYHNQIVARGGNAVSVPSSFKMSGVKLTVGSVKPAKETTVMGRIYKTVADAPNQTMTGLELFNSLVARDDWHLTGAKVKYAANGRVCADWVVGYIAGAARKKASHLSVVAGSEQAPAS